jgi:ABC-type uncharacterized transport system fused permease/ATPase subunit
MLGMRKELNKILMDAWMMDDDEYFLDLDQHQEHTYIPRPHPNLIQLFIVLPFDVI